MWWQWHQLDHMQIICNELQTGNHASTSSLNYLQAGCSFWRPTNSVKALKAITTAVTIIRKYERRFTHNNTVYIHYFATNLNSIVNFSDDNATCDIFLVLWITWSFHITGTFCIWVVTSCLMALWSFEGILVRLQPFANCLLGQSVLSSTALLGTATSQKVTLDICLAYGSGLRELSS